MRHRSSASGLIQPVIATMRPPRCLVSTLEDGLLEQIFCLVQFDERSASLQIWPPPRRDLASTAYALAARQDKRRVQFPWIRHILAADHHAFAAG